MKLKKEKDPDWRISSPVFSEHCPERTSSLCLAVSEIIKRTWKLKEESDNVSYDDDKSRWEIVKKDTTQMRYPHITVYRDRQ